MNDNENSATRLWIEDISSGRKAASDKPARYQTYKMKVNKKNLSIIDNFLKVNRLKLDVLLNAAWGLLLNRYSTADSIIFGSGKTKKALPLMIVKSQIGEETSLSTYINKIKTQLAKTAKLSANLPDELRYLILLAKKTNDFDPSKISLILCADSKDLTELSFAYNPILFHKEKIECFSEHFLLLLTEMCQNIKQKVVKINLLTEHEKKILLHDWNSPRYDFSIPTLTGCMHDLFSQQAKMHPDHLAVNCQDSNITYQQLDQASTYLAQTLLNKGIKTGEHVGVLMERTPILIMSMLAIFKCGATYVPINPKYPNERIEYVLKDCQAKYVLVNELTRLPAKFHDHAMILDASINEYLKQLNNQPLPIVDPDHIAYIIYTSGTTGNPKGVMIKHKSLVNLIAWYRGCFKVTHHDRASQFSSQGFDTYLCEVIPYLASGASVHIVDDSTKLSPPLFFEWLGIQKITLCDLPTSYAQMLFSLTWPNNLNLRLVKIGGESVTHYPTQRFPFDIWDGYGPTEATIESTFNKILPANTLYKPANEHMPPPIGKPISNYEVYIVDKYLQPVPIGVCGELLIGGAGVAAGYLNQPDITKQKFISHLFDSNQPGKLYRTGDLARWLPDGNLEYIGRIDFQVKIRGYRIELGDIENAIIQHPDINEVIVLAKENITHDKSLIAYIVPNLGKVRYLFQERCLVSLGNNQFIEALTEDISKDGIAITNTSHSLSIGQLAQITLKLPGLNESKTFSARVIWSQAQRSGFLFEGSDVEKSTIAKSVDYYLSLHNVMEMVLSASAKRNLRKALQRKLPDYMIPSLFVTLLQFPLSFSGKIDVKALPPPQEFEQLLQKKFIEPKTRTEKELTALWGDILKRNSISMSDSFFDLGGNSILTAELSVRILQAFNISVPAKILFDLPYIPILAEFIDSNGEKYTSQSFIQEEVVRDCKLPEHISPSNKLSPTVSKPQHILLTGAGGFLGVFLLKDLLEKTDAKIYCLIRKGEFDSAAKRLMATVETFNLSDAISLNDRRIIAIASDISFDDFGLPSDQYNSLLNKIDLIYHCGAQVNIMASYNKMRGSNVIGTLEVIKFATRQVNKPIHYVSTLSSAYKKNADGHLMEEFPDDNYGDLFGGYAISKWVSERLLTEAKNRGLPIAIYRSGYISGHSQTGITSLNDALLLLIKGCIQLGFAPDWQEKMTILPVDFVSKSIVSISLAKPDTSAVYHVDHPTGMRWTELVDWINKEGYPVKTIPMSEWQAKLVTLDRNNAIYPFLPYYMALPSNQASPNVNADRASALLKLHELHYPDINHELLTTYFNYLREVNFLPQPTAKQLVSS